MLIYFDILYQKWTIHPKKYQAGLWGQLKFIKNQEIGNNKTKWLNCRIVNSYHTNTGLNFSKPSVVNSIYESVPNILLQYIGKHKNFGISTNKVWYF